MPKALDMLAPKPGWAFLLRYVIAFVVCLTLVLGFVGWYGTHLMGMSRSQAFDRAEAIGRTVLAMRSWGATHRGVYVPADAQTPPNPYLHAEFREVLRSDGTTLTLMNPAYMTRQIGVAVGEEFRVGDRDAVVRLVSDRPLNPINAPIGWERTALAELERGAERVATFDAQERRAAVALPVRISEPCLACHEQQGYGIGDLRGALHVNIYAGDGSLPAHEKGVLLVVGLVGCLGAATVTGAVGRYDWARETQASRDRAVAEHLRRSEALLSEAQRVASVGSIVMDEGFGSWSGSEQLDRIMGIDEEYPRTREGWLELLHSEDRASFEQSISRWREERAGDVEGEYRIVRHDDGETRWIRLTAEVMRGTDGEPSVLGAVQDVTQSKLAERQLTLHRDRLKALAAELAAVQERERKALAEELHDRIAQVLAVAKLHLQGAMADGSVDSEDARVAADLLREAIAETRALMHGLSHPSLYELGVRPAVEWLCEDLNRRYGLVCSMEGDTSSDALTEDARGALFRAARELLMNVVKHAEPSAARVVLAEDDRFVWIAVEDDGPGIAGGDVGRLGSYGLMSIEERLASIGGELTIGPGERGGVRAVARVPKS